MKTVSEHIRIADHYLANGQFENAARAYETAVQSFHASCDMTDLRGLEGLEGVSSLGAEIAGMDGTPHPLAGLQSPVHDALVTAYGREILEGLGHFVGFKCPGTEHWVVSYHARKPFVLDGLSVPTGRPRVFTLVPTKDGLAAWSMPDLARAQLSYLLAHISWARTDEATRLYMQDQILSDSGAAALHATAQLLQRALALRPTYAWAHGRLGELYRRIANGWPGYGDSLFDPESRVRCYVIALLHYQEALSLAPDAPGAFWVHAHLGAALVNVRAFAGVVHEPESPALAALMAAWFPGSTPREAYHLLTLEGQAALVEGQRGAGNYYPWAEDYYGATILFEGLVAREGQAADLAILSFLTAIDALYLQPSILKHDFEPGVLYVNPFLQWGLLTFWLRELERAWTFTRSGMGRLFKFEFLPGVQALQGFQILINVAAEMLEEVPGSNGAGALPPRTLALMSSEVGLDFSVGGVKIPERPISDRQELITFIDAVMTKVGEPSIARVMPAEIVLNSNLEMSLVQDYFVFENFQTILEGLGGDTSLVSRCMHEIAHKLGFAPAPAAPHGTDPGGARDALFCAMMAGKPTYSMAARIRRMRGTPQEG